MKVDLTLGAHELIHFAFVSTEAAEQPKAEVFSPSAHEVCGDLPLHIRHLFCISEACARFLKNETGVSEKEMRRVTQKKKVIDQLISCEMIAQFMKDHYSGLALLSDWKVAGIIKKSLYVGYRADPKTQVEII